MEFFLYHETHALVPSAATDPVRPFRGRPCKELRGFQRITLKPAGKRTVTFTLPAAKLAFWDERTHAFLIEPGAFEIMVGASSADIRARDILEVVGQ